MGDTKAKPQASFWSRYPAKFTHSFHSTTIYGPEQVLSLFRPPRENWVQLLFVYTRLCEMKRQTTKHYRAYFRVRFVRELNLCAMIPRCNTSERFSWERLSYVH